MLRGRYGIGWMIVAWLVIVALLTVGIYLVGNWPASSSASGEPFRPGADEGLAIV